MPRITAFLAVQDARNHLEHSMNIMNRSEQIKTRHDVRMPVRSVKNISNPIFSRKNFYSCVLNK